MLPWRSLTVVRGSSPQSPGRSMFTIFLVCCIVSLIVWLSCTPALQNIFHTPVVLASEGWWEAWQPSPRYPGTISGQRQSWKTPGEFVVSKSMWRYIFPSVLWHCCLSRKKGIRPVKKLDVGLLVVMIWLELCTTYSSNSPVAPPPASSFASINTG